VRAVKEEGSVIFLTMMIDDLPVFCVKKHKACFLIILLLNLRF
jgi:hypothetical protein